MTTTIYLFKYAQQCNHINIFSLNSPNNLISNSTKYIQKAGSDASGLIDIKYSTVYYSFWTVKLVLYLIQHSGKFTSGPDCPQYVPRYMDQYKLYN